MRVQKKVAMAGQKVHHSVIPCDTSGAIPTFPTPPTNPTTDLRRHTVHIRNFQNVCKVFVEVPCDVGVDGHFVLPFKFRPHRAEVCVRTGGGEDVVHNVDVDVVDDHHTLRLKRRCYEYGLCAWICDADDVPNIGAQVRE